MRTDIYFAGYLGDGYTKRGVLWKNGKIEFESAEANYVSFCDVTVINGDQYIVGDIIDANVIQKAKLWKNGKMINLIESDRASYALRIEVVNNRPIILLFEENGAKAGFGSIKLWDNGTITEITKIDQEFTPVDFTYHNGKYYIVGFHFSQPQQMTPVLISGNKIEYLPIPDSLNAMATSLALVNNEIYVLGTETDIVGNSHIVYWKNGDRQRLTRPEETGMARRINVLGQDIYVGGALKFADNSYEVPTIWKNGVSKQLSDSDEIGLISDFVFDGEDQHAVGQTTQNSLYKVKYWKNGVSQELERNSINGLPYGLILRIYIDKTNQ